VDAGHARDRLTAVAEDRPGPTEKPAFALRGREVSCAALKYVFLELERRGEPIEPIVRGLPYPMEHLRDPRQRIDWQSLCILAARCERFWTEDGVFALGKRAHAFPLGGWMCALARLLFEPLEYYRWSLREFCRKFACIESSVLQIEPGVLRCQMHMREGYEPSHALFAALRGGLIGMPMMLGLPAASVEAEHFESGAVFLVHLPPGGGRLAWLRRLATWPISGYWTSRELRHTYATLHDRYCDLVRKDHALRERARDMRALMDQASDAIVICDRDLIVRDVNRRLCEWSGYAREQLLGMRAQRLIDPKDGEEPWQGLRGAGPQRLLETELQHRSGQSRMVEISCNRLDDGRLQWILRDISIRRRADEERRRTAEQLGQQLERHAEELAFARARSQELQQRLIQAERMRAAEDLAASLAHAINNPLAALIGTLELDCDARAQAAGSAAQALRIAQRIKRIVAETLLLFQKGSLDVVATVPRDLLDEVCTAVRQRAELRGVRVRVESPDPMPAIEIDRQLTATALTAIAENGIEAMTCGGTLLLSASALRSVPVVCIQVIDEGSGIPVQLRNRVLEPFFTTKGGGTGLGLTIAQGIIQGQGGRLRISDRRGGGTIVSVELGTQRGAAD
jgi:PAS domain S-box-containing protein